MLQGFVAGELWASIQHPALAGSKLLLVQPEAPNSQQQELVAVDLVGAGVGDRVLVALGRAARNALGNPDAPVEAAIIAVVDDLQREIPTMGTSLGSGGDRPQPSGGPRQPSLKKKAKKKTKEAADETLDLFSGMDEDNDDDTSVQQESSDRLPSELPSIDDVDRIWGDTEEEEESSS